MSITEERTAIIPFPNGDTNLSYQDALRHWRQEAAYRQAFNPTIFLSSQEAVRGLSQTMAQTQQAMAQMAASLHGTQEVIRIEFSRFQDVGKHIGETISRGIARNERIITAIPRSPTGQGDIFRPEGVPTDTEFLIAHTDWDTITAMCAAEGYTFESAQPGMAQFYQGMANITIYKAQSHTIVRVNAPEITHEKLRITVCHYVLRGIAECWARHRRTYIDLGTISAASPHEPAQIADALGVVPQETRRKHGGRRPHKTESEYREICEKWLVEDKKGTDQNVFCDNHKIGVRTLQTKLDKFGY